MQPLLYKIVLLLYMINNVYVILMKPSACNYTLTKLVGCTFDLFVHLYISDAIVS